MQVQLTPLDQLPEIRFSFNWNNKLHCKFFTTIRCANYVVGQVYKIVIKDNVPFRVKVVAVKSCLLEQLPAFTAMTDTGYTLQETKELLKKMHPYVKDWSTHLIHIYLLENIEF